MNTSVNNSIIKYHSGYDLPLDGLDTGDFEQLHITALGCIFVSCISAVAVLCMSYSEKKHKVVGFFQWRQISRFVVYMAICDCLFNIIHSMDHFHVFLTRDHPHPEELCQLYAFLLVEFVGAQVLMVNLVAVNMFVLIFFNKRINFGRCDWKLLLWMFGYPFAANVVGICTDSLGPNGSFCFFDGVNGNIMQLVMITVPQGLIIVINSILYFLTWLKIRQQQPQLKAQRGYERRVTKRAHKAAKNMILLVVMFLIQWCAPSIYGLWRALGYSVPLSLLQCVVVSANIGGVLNGIVFLILRHNEANSRESSYRSFENNSRTSTIAIMAAATAAAAAVTSSTANIIETVEEKSNECPEPEPLSTVTQMVASKALGLVLPAAKELPLTQVPNKMLSEASEPALLTMKELTATEATDRTSSEAPELAPSSDLNSLPSLQTEDRNVTTEIKSSSDMKTSASSCETATANDSSEASSKTHLSPD